MTPNPHFEKTCSQLRARPARWLVTGAAGFIGSNLVEALLKLDQHVVGLDNFSNGFPHNIEIVRGLVSPEQRSRFRFIEADITDLEACKNACAGNDYVLHQAALGSVPRSLADPIRTNQSNIDGFLNMLVATRDSGVKRFVYAASSSTYGDHPALPKVEGVIGKPLSPYAVTKYVNELYAEVFSRCYGLHSIGLRYFNVFGPRQNPEGAYAAAIPLWFASLLKNEKVFINGDGETSRDFCYVANAVQANILAATVESEDATNQVYNVAVGDRTTLNQVFAAIRDLVSQKRPELKAVEPVYREFRKGDVRHSQANVDKAREKLGYIPSHRVEGGLKEAAAWYMRNS